MNPADKFSPITDEVRETLRQFQPEFCTYLALLAGCLADGDEGRFIVIRGTESLGTWDTYRDALETGYAQWGDAPFLVRRIQQRDQRDLAELLQREGLWQQAAPVPPQPVVSEVPAAGGV